MPNPRLGLFDGSVVTMFPRKLMNTAVSASLLSGSQYARHIENIIPNSLKAGSGAKRYGCTAKGNEIPGVTILRIMEYRTSIGGIEFLAYCDDGSIRKLNEGTGAWTSLITGLSANGNPRWVAFNEKIIIVDGVNTPMSYNGSAISTLKEWVTDYITGLSIGLATGAGQTDTNTITVTVGAGRNDYTLGQRIRVTFTTAGAITATISAVSGTTTKTIDVTGTPFPSPSETITKVEYEKSPPAFSDIFVKHGRLWALSAGQSRAREFRNPADAMKVFYTDALNNENSWYNEDTEEVGYVNLLNLSGVFDELVKISSIDGYMVFFGRLGTILYSGDDPTTAGGFVFEKRIPVGCVNGNLVQEYPSDILFFTRYGARSLRTVFQTEGQEVVSDLGTDVDPTVTTFIGTMTGSDALFRNARSFFYERDGFYGYNFGADYTLAYALSEESKGWVFFSGLFKDASDYHGTSDGRLFLAAGGQLYSYGNGTDGDVTYGDDGANILVKWWTPWLRPRVGRWANIGYEVVMEDVSATDIQMLRALDDIEDTTTPAPLEISLTEGSSYWDEAYWDVGYWDGVRRRLIVRDKFLCDSFYLIVQNESTAGPLSFIGIKPIGR